jgi:hypothetical protein
LSLSEPGFDKLNQGTGWFSRFVPGAGKLFSETLARESNRKTRLQVSVIDWV